MHTEVCNISRRVCEVALGDYSLAPVPSINSSQCHSTRKGNVQNEIQKTSVQFDIKSNKKVNNTLYYSNSNIGVIYSRCKYLISFKKI